MAVTYINFVKVDGLPYTNKAARLPKACQSGSDQETDGSIEQVSLRIFDYPLADIHRFLGLSMLSQFIVEVGENHVMRTILQKNITIEVGLIEQADQVDIQDPPF